MKTNAGMKITRYRSGQQSGPDADQAFIDYVDTWIGIPWKLNGENKKVGLDCRTLASQFLKGQGIGVKDSDGLPMPEKIEGIDVERYERGVKAAGVAVDLKDLRRNDVVYFRNKYGRLHIGIWLGYNKMLTTDLRTGAIIVRMKPEWLTGAVRGREGAWLDMPPGHDPVTAVLAAIGTALTAGAATGTTAVVIGAIAVISTAASIGFGIAAMSAGRKAFNFDSQGLGASQRYSLDGARNIRSNQFPVPLIYGAGPIRILQTYEIWNSGTETQEQKRAVVIGVGELGSITDVELNGEPIGDFTGSSATTYTGTSSQGIDSRLANSNITSLRHRAYIALTMKASEKLSGDPVITCKVTGRKIARWNGSDWTTLSAATDGNPAAIIRDYLITSREIGGCGYPTNQIDDTSFGEVYDHLEVLIADGSGGSEARGRLDLVIDSFRPWLDNLQDMMATFGGFLVTDGRKFFLRVEKDETAVQAFTDDNITNLSYQTFTKESRPNRIIGQYVDITAQGNDARTRASIDDLTDQATNPRGIVPQEVGLLGIQRQSQAIREITKILNDARTNWYTISFLTDINAIAIEPGDVITVKHPVLGDGLTTFKFRVFRIQEAGNHQVKIIAKAHTASVYNDEFEQQVVTLDYTIPKNPFDPVADVTGLSVQAVGFLQKDGAFVSNLQVTWTEPIETLGLKHYLLEWEEDGGAFEEKLNVFPGVTKATIPLAKVDSSYRVKVITVNKFDIKSTGIISTSITVNGDTAPPSDVTGFDARQLGDKIILSWQAVADVDLFGYEIREGGADWDTSSLIDTTVSGTRYVIVDFGAGTKTYRIKAIDLSGNFSLNAASDSFVSTSPSDSNILFTYDLFHNGLRDGVLTAGAERQPTSDFIGGYRRYVVGLKTILRTDTYAGTWENLETVLDWTTEHRETTLENYTSEAVDIGSIQVGVVSIAHKAIVPSGTVTIEWAFSDTDSNPSTFVAFVEGVFTVRYFKIRTKIQTTDTTKNVKVYELNVTIDVKDLIDRGENEAISAGGTSISFNKTFTVSPAIGITTLTNPYIPYITVKSASAFTVKLRDPVTDTDKAGNIDWIAKGF